MKRLYLVGTQHLDIKGPERLRKFLDFVRPESIGIECDKEYAERRISDSKVALSELKTNEALLRIRVGTQGYNKLFKFLTMLGYEVIVPSQYKSQNTQVRILYLDDFPEEQAVDIRKRIFGEEVDEQGNFNENFFNKISRINLDSFSQTIDRDYDDCSVKSFSQEDLERLLVLRDRKVELKLREVFGSAISDVAYIGGTNHFFANYHNLYERLKDLNPVRVKLKDIDSFELSRF